MIRTLPTFRRGTRWQDVRAVDLQAMSDGVKQSLDGVEAAKRWHLRGLPRFKHPGAALGVKLAYFRAIWSGPGREFLMCTTAHPATWNETPATDFKVALPYMLRKDPWQSDGRPWGTRTSKFTYVYSEPTRRVATRIGGVAETQDITPSYQEADPLLIARVPGNAIWLAENPDGLVWLDLNIDARAWAAIQTVPTP